MPPLNTNDPRKPGLVGKWLSNPDPRQQSPRPTAGDTECRFVQLPQRPAGGGYYTYGTPHGGAGQYGVPDTIGLIQEVANGWRGTPFGVGNISLADGGRFDPHRSHRTGTDVDVRPLRSDGANTGADWRKAGYDRAATQRLVDAFLASGRVRNIWFNDPAIKGVSPYKGHNDHFHVNVRSACTRR